MIAASLLLFLEEEEAFWVMCTIVEDLLPASYYSSTLLGKNNSRTYSDLFLEEILCWGLIFQLIFRFQEKTRMYCK